MKESEYYVHRIMRDGKPVTKFMCPNCKRFADIDEDQLVGKVSIICISDGCTFHETIDLRPALEEYLKNYQPLRK